MENLIQLTTKLRYYIEKASIALDDNDAVEAIYLFPNWSSEEKQYEVGDRVRFDNFLYKCLINHISNENKQPSASSLLWEKMISSALNSSEIERYDSKKEYQLGDKVSYNNKIYESTISNNIWQPRTGTFWIEV